MAYFDDLLASLASDEEEAQDDELSFVYKPPKLSKARRFAPKARPEVQREVLKEVRPENQDLFNRIKDGVLGDVRDLYTGLSTLAGLPLTPAGRETLGRGVKAVREDPLGVAKTLGKAFIEPYQRQEGEDVGDVVARQLLDHPLSTLMDAAGLLGGVGLAMKGAGAVTLAPKLYKAGAKVADAATYLDPVAQAARGGKMLARTAFPSLDRKLELRAVLKETQKANALKTEFVEKRKAEQIKVLMQEMTPTEASLFHPWSQGLIPTPAGVADDFTQRMQNYGQKWEAIHKDYEVALGLDPETIAQDVVTQAWKNKKSWRTMAPDDVRAEMDSLHDEALAGALDQQQYRRTFGKRNQVYDAKAKQWNEAVAKTKLENLAAGVIDDATWLRPIPDTRPDMKLMNEIPTDDITRDFEVGQGRIYMPHSAETLTYEMATIPNLLGKVREALPWKFNRGALLRTGMLDRLAPVEKLRELEEKLGDVMLNGTSKAAAKLRAEMEATKQPLTTALLSMNKEMARRVSETNIYQALADFAVEKGWAEKIKLKEGRLMTDKALTGDPDRGIKATHQILWPNGRMRMYALSNELEPLLDGLFAHSDSPLVSRLNAIDIVRKASEKMDKTIGMARGSAYKIPKDMGDLIAGFHKMFNPSTSSWIQALDGATDVWRFTTLNIRPAWVVNNLFGNIIFGAMYGLHPFNPAAYKSYFDAFRAWGSKEYGWFGEQGKKLARVYELPGITQGGLFGTEATAVRTAAGFTGSTTGEALLRSGSRVARGVGKVGEGVAQFNQGLESWFRAAATIHGLKRTNFEQMARSGKSILEAMDVGERLTTLSEMGADALVSQADFRSALAFTNKALNDYSLQSPFQRNVLRRVMPFQSFYLHAFRVATHYPFDRAAQATLIRSLAKQAKEDLKDQVEMWGMDWDQDVPNELKDSIPIDRITDGAGNIMLRMLNTRGPNPLSVVTQADPGADSLANLNPIIKVGIEFITGVDLFTMERAKGPMSLYGGKEVNAEGLITEGTVRMNPVENFLEQFWPYRAVKEEVAGGRKMYATTTLIDQLFNEKVAYRTDPETGKPITKPRVRGTGFLRALVPTVPQLVEPRTKEQLRQQKQVYSETMNRLWRQADDEEKARLRALIAQKKMELLPGGLR